MYTCYEVVLKAEDGEYPLETFQSEQAAYNWIVVNRPLYGEGQELVIRTNRRGF